MWAYTVDLGYDGSTAETFNWTTTPPEQDGFYWAMEKNGKPCVVEAYYLIHGPLRVNKIGMEISFSLSHFTHWLGPLPVPAPPKE